MAALNANTQQTHTVAEAVYVFVYVLLLFFQHKAE